MKVKVNINVNKTAKRIINDDVKLFANNTLYKICDPYVPFKDGGLSQNVDINEEYIHYKSPYARKIYNGQGMNFNKDKHPLATAKWAKVAMQSKKQQLIDDIQNYINRR